MVERLITVSNILAGFGFFFVVLLWIICAISIVTSKHSRDSWGVVTAPLGGITFLAFFFGTPCLAWMYVMGVFS